MSIRARIFAVIGLVVAAAFAQTLFVVHQESQRGVMLAAMDRALWRYESQSKLVSLVSELDSVQRAAVITGDPALRLEYDRLWGVYEHSVTLLPQYIDEAEIRQELSNIDSQLRDWHANASLVLLPMAGPNPETQKRADDISTPRMRRIRNDVDRFETRERNRLTEQRILANSQSLRATLLTLAIPAIAIVLLLLLVAFVARILLDPLAAVAQSARQISGGNFDVSLPPASRDEIGALVRAFREMTTAVQRRQRDLTDALSREREVSHLLATQRAKAEREHERLRATLETVPVALLLIDAETTRIVLQNGTADALIGREPEEPAARMAYWQGFSARLRDGAPTDFLQTAPARILRGEIIAGEEIVLRHPDGRVIPILISAAPLRDDKSTIVGAVVAFQDITNLYEVDRLKSEFVSIVSHELRTPLTAIKGALQLLLAEMPIEDEDHRTLMNVALSNTDRLVRIINDILDISKIEAGKLELRIAAHSVGEVIAVSTQNVLQIAQGSSITIVPEIEPGAPDVRVDLDRAVQVLVNLLSNALKFAPARSVVTLAARREGDNMVRFSVMDKGRGIPADKLNLLFQKFQQLDGASTRKVRGTGLGLAIVKALVEAQGGRVAVDSEVGKGSTFSVTFKAV